MAFKAFPLPLPGRRPPAAGLVLVAFSSMVLLLGDNANELLKVKRATRV